MEEDDDEESHLNKRSKNSHDYWNNLICLTSLDDEEFRETTRCHEFSEKKATSPAKDDSFEMDALLDSLRFDEANNKGEKVSSRIKLPNFQVCEGIPVEVKSFYERKAREHGSRLWSGSSPSKTPYCICDRVILCSQNCRENEPCSICSIDRRFREGDDDTGNITLIISSQIFEKELNSSICASVKGPLDAAIKCHADS